MKKIAEISIQNNQFFVSYLYNPSILKVLKLRMTELKAISSRINQVHTGINRTNIASLIDFNEQRSLNPRLGDHSHKPFNICFLILNYRFLNLTFTGVLASIAFFSEFPVGNQRFIAIDEARFRGLVERIDG